MVGTLRKKRTEGRSKLSQQINDGSYGIENMDYRYLVQDLVENEGELRHAHAVQHGSLRDLHLQQFDFPVAKVSTSIADGMRIR